jgi:subtilisin family serine protease
MWRAHGRFFRSGIFSLAILLGGGTAMAGPPPMLTVEPVSPVRINPDDRNYNRLDDELEGLFSDGALHEVEFFLEFERSLWEQYRGFIVPDIQAHLTGNAEILYEYEAFPGVFIANAELQYPLWVSGEYEDPLLLSLFEEMELPPQMIHALHWFYPAGRESNSVPDYLIADRISPEVWEPQYLPDPLYSAPTGLGALVAILDTGADTDGIDNVFVAGGYDVLSGQENDPSDLSAGVLNHGTQVAYLAQGWSRSASNEYGAAPLAALLDVRIVDPTSADFSTSSAEIGAALEWIHQRRNDTFYVDYEGGITMQGIDAVNISFADGGPTAHRFVPGGGSSDPCDGFVPSSGHDPLSLAVNYIAHYDNIAVVSAAGNCGEPPLAGFGELAAAQGGITVGAYEVGDPADRNDDLVYTWSNHDFDPPRSQKPDLVAPGAAYGMLGTSFAAPQVAGTVALMRQENPDVTAAEIREALRAGANLGYHDPYWGHGVLDADAGLNALP